MQIFISWSGDTSREIAGALKKWLPKVLQAAKPYYTPDDIEKGAKWQSEILSKLNECTIGIICITPENVEKPWILFEAGALSNRSDIAIVCTLLFNIKKANISGPLSMFQATEFTKKDFFDLLKTINSKLGENNLSNDDLKEVFDLFYPKLEKEVKDIIEMSSKPVTAPVERDQREILEEILEIVRRPNQSYAVMKPGTSHLTNKSTEKVFRPTFRYEVFEDLGSWHGKSMVTGSIVSTKSTKEAVMEDLVTLATDNGVRRLIIYSEDSNVETEYILE